MLGLVDGGGHGDDQYVAGFEVRHLRGETQAAGRPQLADTDLARGVVAALEIRDALRVDVETDGSEMPADGDAQWQPHVSKADDTDHGLVVG